MENITYNKDGSVQITEFEFSEEELKLFRKNEIQHQIEELKQNLKDYDHKGQKYIDGEYTEEEWAEIKAQRKQWREQIRELEKELN